MDIGTKKYIVDVHRAGYVFNKYTGPSLIEAQKIYEELSPIKSVREIIIYERTVINHLYKPLI